MIDSDILSILKKQYNNYSGNLSFEEAVQALSGLVVKQNKAEQLYIHHAEKCGTEVIIPYGIDFIKAGAFRNQTNLKKVDIQARITELQRYTFVYCSQLEEISLPDSLLSIGDGAFEGCTSLEHITIPASVQEIQYGIISPQEFSGVIRTPAGSVAEKNAQELGLKVENY